MAVVEPVMPNAPSPPALRVLQPPPADVANQNCSVCFNFNVCWDVKAQPRHIQTNILVCRLKRGIDRDRATRLLLDMLKPKLLRLVQSIRFMTGGMDINVGEALADAESETVKVLLKDWILGELAFPLHYLFGIPSGVMGRWARAYASKLRRHEHRDDVVIGHHEDETEALHVKAPVLDDRIAKARAIIEDGRTLSAAEYRVLTFVLEHADNSRRPHSQALAFLAHTMNISRARVNEIYEQATRCIAEQVG